MFSTIHMSEDDRKEAEQTGHAMSVFSVQKPLCVGSDPGGKAPIFLFFCLCAQLSLNLSFPAPAASYTPHLLRRWPWGS